MARFLNIEEEASKNKKASIESVREYPFALNFTGMAIEAYRRDKITYDKLVDLSARVKFGSEVIDQVLSCMGLENNREEAIYLPE